MSEIIKTRKTLSTTASNLPINAAEEAASVVHSGADALARLEARRNNVLTRLFPDAQERERNRGELAQIRDEFEYRRKALQMAREVTIQSLTSMYDHFLIQGKSGLQTETTKCLLNHHAEFEAEVNRVSQDFFKALTARWKEAEACPIEPLRESQFEMIDESMKGFRSVVSTLTEQFAEIVKTTVRPD